MPGGGFLVHLNGEVGSRVRAMGVGMLTKLPGGVVH